jgi:hypothetical protein
MNLFDASAPRHHAQTLLLLFALAISAVGNAMSIWWYGGKVTHYIPVTITGETGAAMTSRPGVFPLAIQTHVAELVVKTLGNVTPDSLLPAIQAVRPYLEPSTYVALHAQGQAEAATMHVADVSVMTTDVVLSEVNAMQHQGRFDFTRLKFRAVRHLFSYGMALKPHDVTVVVDVMPPPIGRGVGEALRVTHIAWPPLKIKDGDIQDFTFEDQITKSIKPFRRGVTR